MGKRDDRIHSVELGPFGTFGLTVFQSGKSACGVRRDIGRLSDKPEQVTCTECATVAIVYYAELRDSMIGLINNYVERPTWVDAPEHVEIVKGAEEARDLAIRALEPWQKKTSSHQILPDRPPGNL